MVPMQARSARWAFMPANGQAFLDHDTTARAHLARERTVYRYYPLPGAFSLESKDGEKRAPPCIGDALGKVTVPDHIADLQIFVIDHIIGSHQGERRLVMKVLSLTAHQMVRFR
jgi:hypothetical protein